MKTDAESQFPPIHLIDLLRRQQEMFRSVGSAHDNQTLDLLRRQQQLYRKLGGQYESRADRSFLYTH